MFKKITIITAVLVLVLALASTTVTAAVVVDGLSVTGVLYFTANLTYVISYAVTNMVWLRMLAIMAGLATLPYLYFQVEPLWLAIFCQFMFISINVLNLIKHKLTSDRSPLKLS